MPTLVELAQDVVAKHDAFTVAKTAADASTAQAAVDQGVETAALKVVEDAIAALIAAAKAEDPVLIPPVVAPVV